MIYLLSILIFLAIVAATWFMGLWSNLLTLINFILAAMIATNIYEPICDAMERSGSEGMTYLLDFLILWGVFFISFGLFRLATDLLSSYRVKFNLVVELVGRSVLSIWIAIAFLSFALFTLHTAPLPEVPFGSFQRGPESKGLDRLWLGFAQSRSRGAFAEFRNGWFLPEYQEDEHPKDVGKNRRVFDSKSDFIFKYHDRRRKFMEQEGFTVKKSVPAK